VIAAILCPGPSLVETCISDASLSVFDVVIAVNRAIMLRPGIEKSVHWHACGDWDTLYSIPSKPTVGICSQRDVARITKAGQHAALYAGLRWEAWEDLGVGPGYSTISAIALAAKLGAEHLMVFGDDKNGTLDWDGTPGRLRNGDRWDRERQLQNRAVEKLKLDVQYVQKAAV
jgi:hypothetical protein